MTRAPGSAGGADPTGLGTLMQELRPRLTRLAAGILRDREEGEDVVQDTLAAVWKGRGRIRADNWTAYMVGAVRLNAIKRASRRRLHVSLDEHPGREPAVQLPEAGDGLADLVSPFDLERAIEALPVNQQTALRMRYYLGHSFRQIGEALAISTFTAASRCRYALSTLRRVLIQTQSEQGGSRHDRLRRH